MPRKLYSIKDLSPGFDGLLVEVDEKVKSPDVLLNVTRIINRNSIFGDREVSYPFAEDGIFIDARFLEPVDDPALREYDSKNPFGKVQFEGHYTKGNLNIAYCQYEKALQVTVLEKVPNQPTRTKFSQYFMQDIPTVRAVIEATLADDEVEDLVFELQHLKEKESDG